MKWVLIVASLIAMIGTAAAKTYEYTARTERPVKKTGAVTASGLTWQCSGTKCRISGPWPTPGVGACAALAKKVGRIIEYGHPKAKLNKKQRARCNKSVGVTGTAKPRVLITPEIAKRLQIPNAKIQIAPKLGTKAPTTPTPSRRPAPELAIEEGSFEDYTLYVRTRTSIEFHGVYEGTYSLATPGTPRLSWTGNTLRLPGLRHRGTDEPGEQHPRPLVVVRPIASRKPLQAGGSSRFR